MKIGQRINLIKKIATKLSEFDYAEGDLVLRAFGLPWTDQWGGDSSYQYYIQMVEDGDSEKLIELHDYLSPDDTLPVSTKQGNGHWPKGVLRIFLSHSTTKKLKVTQVKKELRKYGIDCFVAHEDIQPTKEWLREIRVALETCHCLVSFICEEFPKSSFCDQEVGFALQRGILVIPVRLGVDPYGFMAPLQGVQAKDRNPEDIAMDIYKILSGNTLTKNLVLKANNKAFSDFVDKFLTSSNFGDSSSMLKKLEDYEAGTIPMVYINKIAENWEKNDQIKFCNGIPKRMAKFLNRHGYRKDTDEIPF